jgi:2-dehydro-3-deoxyphosphogluconate aldolase/(4S)-4-hydroxy-2-oxoglutarate aldolase
MSAVDDLMRLSPVIPVLVIDDVADAVPVAQALVAGGIRVLEVTLRTPAALDVLRAMAAVPGTVVGAGTVINAAQLDAAADAGARFVISPGISETVAAAAARRSLPYLPGVQTASDLMRGFELGLDRFKFFPAETSGGRAALAALAAPFGAARFCPTGGITAETAPLWLSHPSVLCVGGSWLVPKGPVDRAAITARARAAANLARG